MTRLNLRKLKAIWALTENTVIAILLATGHTNESIVMLIFKIASSYFMNLFDLLAGDKRI